MDPVYFEQGTRWKQTHDADNVCNQLENQRQRAIRAESEIIDKEFEMKILEFNKTIDAKEKTMLSKIQLYGTVPEDLRIRFQTESEQLRIQVGDMKILQLRLKAALKDKNVTLENFKENGFPQDLTQLSSYLDSIPKKNGSNVYQMNTFSQSTSNGPQSVSVASSLNPGTISYQQGPQSEPTARRRDGLFEFEETFQQPRTNQLAQPHVQHKLGNMSLDDFAPVEKKWEEVPSRKKPTMAEVLKNASAQAQPARPGSANSYKSVEALKEQAEDPTRYLRTKLCDSFTKYGVCSYGDKCLFAHGFNNLRPFLQRATGAVLYKVKLCRNWSETGKCGYGDRCVFAHGEQQLRSYSGYVDSDAPEKDYYKDRLCDRWKKGECQYGDRCRFAHGEDDIHTCKVDVDSDALGTDPEPCAVQQCPKKINYLKRKTSICKFTGKTCVTQNCGYAHSKQERRPLPKYEYCKKFEQGNCQHSDDQCVYAHSEQERRERKEFKGDEADCAICHEKITPHTHYRLACGHEQWHYGLPCQ